VACCSDGSPSISSRSSARNSRFSLQQRLLQLPGRQYPRLSIERISGLVGCFPQRVLQLPARANPASITIKRIGGFNGIQHFPQRVLQLPTRRNPSAITIKRISGVVGVQQRVGRTNPAPISIKHVSRLVRVTQRVLQLPARINPRIGIASIHDLESLEDFQQRTLQPRIS
jgi:hypothetical protein